MKVIPETCRAHQIWYLFFFNWIMDFMVCITILQLYWYVIWSDLFMDETVLPGKKEEKRIQQQVINILYHKELYRVDLDQSGIKLAIEAIWIVCTGRHKSKHHSSQIRLFRCFDFPRVFRSWSFKYNVLQSISTNLIS